MQQPRKLPSSLGFGIVEVLVVTSIMAVGLLALASLQILSVQAVKESEQQTAALLIAEDMAARLRANRTQIDTYVSVPATLTNNRCAPSTGTYCTPSDLAHLDLSHINSRLTAELNSGQLTVTATDVSHRIYTITVSWQGRDNNTQTLTTRTVSIRTQIPQ